MEADFSVIMLGEPVYENAFLPIIILKEISLSGYINGYHEYRSKWVPVIHEELKAEMEPDNIKDKYAMSVMRNGEIVGHIQKGIAGNFAKNIFYFLRADKMSECYAIVSGNPVNLGDQKGMRVPCIFRLTGQPSFIEKMKSIMEKHVQ